MSFDVFPIPAFADNYLWTLVRGQEAVVVDPGDAGPVERTLAERGLSLVAILVTHHHPDHIGGLPRLLDRARVPVYGPAAEARTIGRLTRSLRDGDTVEVLGQTFTVLEVPGHTLGHIAYYTPGTLLCGDTLFSAGCGRLFEGTAAQLHASLARLAQLPPRTAVYCTHEYTAANLAFALAVEPGNAAVRERLAWVRAERAAGRPTLPSTIALERAINPFLRVTEPGVHAAAERWAGAPLPDAASTFAVLRRWKDGFKPPPGPGTTV